MISSHSGERGPEEKLEFAASIPFFLINLLGIAGLYWVVQDWRVFLTAAILYYVRMFFVTGFQHRFFSHRSFRIQGSEAWRRSVQFVMALCVTSTVQKGPLWWAAWHRHHHRHSDGPEDVHSRKLHGLYWSHVGWILCSKFRTADYDEVRDFSSCKELMFLERPVGYLFVPVLIGMACMHFGGLPCLMAFFTSTFLLYHGTFCINSLAHMFGTQRFQTGDESRNCGWLNILTIGEGWHNNHHHQQAFEAQAITWQEKLTDVTHWILSLWSYTGMVKLNLRKAHS
ncbi:MAG TPA: fatty acid desaturase [Candidatus Paceibacterota bacterium]